MTTLNLLPWREQLREERKREFFFGLFAVACLSSLVVLFFYLLMASKTSNQTNLNAVLTEQITQLEAQIKTIATLKSEREQLLNRMQVIQNLQSDRPLVVHLFDQIVRTLPEGIYLSEIDKKDATITLSGKAESNARVSELMRNIDISPWLSDPVLTEIKSSEGEASRIRDFVVQMQQQAPESQPASNTRK